MVFPNGKPAMSSVSLCISQIFWSCDCDPFSLSLIGQYLLIDLVVNGDSCSNDLFVSLLVVRPAGDLLNKLSCRIQKSKNLSMVGKVYSMFY